MDPTIISAVIVGIPTAILAYITYKYMVETKRIRENTQNPNFILEPTMYSLGGTFHQLNLLNTGATAKDIEINCIWERPDEPNSNRRHYYIFSLTTNGTAPLFHVPIETIVKEKQKLMVEIKCRDSRDQLHSQKLEKDFSMLTTDSREIGYQYASNFEIIKSLNDISRQISSLRDSIKNLRR